MSKLRAVVIGIGSVGSSLHKIMLEKGVEIVAAVDLDPSKKGKDLADVIGIEEKTNILISDNLEETLKAVDAEIAVVSVATFEISHPIYKKCVEAGLNVINTDDQCTFPFNLYPELSDELDALARKYGVTVTASGNQDALGVHLPVLISGCCSEISTITALVRTDLNNAGAQTCRDFHAGSTLGSFHSSIGEKYEFRPFRHYAESIASALGMTTIDVDFTDEPLTDTVPVFCKPLDMTIEPGLVTGKNTITEVFTDGGIIIRAEYAVKVFAEGELPKRVWKIEGNPDMNVDYTALGVPPISRATQLVNRIPDVINMTPGLISIDQYSPLRYRARPLHEYIAQ